MHDDFWYELGDRESIRHGVGPVGNGDRHHVVAGNDTNRCHLTDRNVRPVDRYRESGIGVDRNGYLADTAVNFRRVFGYLRIEGRRERTLRERYPRYLHHRRTVVSRFITGREDE